MWAHVYVLAVLCSIAFNGVHGYSKYGRSCEDIGCLNSEVCVIREDPCQYHGSRECGRYPTCERASAGSLSCNQLDCPDGQECRVENGAAKCVSSRTSSSHNTHNDNAGQINPSLPSDGTTSRPRPGAHVPAGSGYNGGQPGSGFPGGRPGSGYPSNNPGSGYSGSTQGSGYPGGSQGSGYPGGSQGSGYPGGSQGSGYPGGNYGSGYPGGAAGSGYPGGHHGFPGSGQGSGLPGRGGYGGYGNQGYPSSGTYNGGYAGQPAGGYNGQNGGYGQQHGGFGGHGSSSYGQQAHPTRKSEGNSLVDSLTSGLKAAAGLVFSLYIQRAFTTIS